MLSLDGILCLETHTPLIFLRKFKCFFFSLYSDVKINSKGEYQSCIRNKINVPTKNQIQDRSYLQSDSFNA